jgi:hypothetical protein
MDALFATYVKHITLRLGLFSNNDGSGCIAELQDDKSNRPNRADLVTLPSYISGTPCVPTTPKSREGNPTLRAQGTDNRHGDSHFRLSSHDRSMAALPVIYNAVLLLVPCLLTIDVHVT